ncbi:hypothetical protein BJX99DRAFT_258189 [Aspergillus californicus]
MSTLQVPDSRSDKHWKAAMKQVSEKYWKKLGLEGEPELIGELLDITKAAIDKCQKGRISIQLSDGNTVYARTVFEKIFDWTNHFKAVGDIAIQYDPTPAALPWAGFRFLLQGKCIMNDTQTYAFFLEHLNFIAGMISRYAVFERLHLKSGSDAASKLEDALIQLYRLKGMTGLLPKFQKLFQAILDAERLVEQCAQMVTVEAQFDGHDELTKLLSDMGAPLKSLKDAVQRIEDHLDGNKRLEILKWISEPCHSKSHREVRRKFLRGTGQWLEQERIYRAWKADKESSILWLIGIKGAGKTCLESFVIEDSPRPVYFYCNQEGDASTRPSRSDEVLASLVRQLAQVPTTSCLLEPVTAMYAEQDESGFGKLDREESQRLIGELLVYHPKPTTVIIDALDACDTHGILEILQVLHTLMQQSEVKLFISSCDNQDIRSFFKGQDLREINIGDKNTEDIRQVVKWQTDRILKKTSCWGDSRCRYLEKHNHQ